MKKWMISINLWFNNFTVLNILDLVIEYGTFLLASLQNNKQGRSLPSFVKVQVLISLFKEFKIT